MFTSRFSILPNGFVICASSLLCAGVVCLQNADNYALKMETPLLGLAGDMRELAELLPTLPDRLRSIGHATLAVELNAREKQGLRLLSAAVGSAPADDAPELLPEAPCEAVAQETAPSVPTEAAAEPAQPVVEAEPEPAAATPEPAAAQEAPALAVAEPPAESAAPVPAVAERVTIPAAESAWWPVLQAAKASSHGSVYLSALSAVRAGRDHAQAAAPEPPAQAPAVEQPVEQEPPVVAVEPPAAPAEVEPAPDPQPAAALPWYAAVDKAAVAASGLSETPPVNCRIMLVGDSLMEDMGPRIHRAMNRRKGLNFVVSAKFSTGLCRPDVFSWPAHMREEVRKRKPDIVVFFIGANDGMPIKEGRRYVSTGTEKWRQAYGRKMEELITIAREADAEVIWVEIPAVGGRYNKELHQTQIAQREYCEGHGILHLPTDPLFSGEWGRFEPFGEYKGKQVRLRTRDLTHLSPEGNSKLLDVLLPLIEQRLTAFYLSHPERRLTEQQVAGIRRVPVVYTCRYSQQEKAPAKAPAAPEKKVVPPLPAERTRQ